MTIGIIVTQSVSLKVLTDFKKMLWVMLEMEPERNPYSIRVYAVIGHYDQYLIMSKYICDYIYINRLSCCAKIPITRLF